MHMLKRKLKKKNPPNNSINTCTHFGLAAYVVLEKNNLACEEVKVFPF